MKRIIAYFAAIIQFHIELEREREKTCAKMWELEQKRRRASLEEQNDETIPHLTNTP